MEEIYIKEIYIQKMKYKKAYCDEVESKLRFSSNKRNIVIKTKKNSLSRHFYKDFRFINYFLLLYIYIKLLICYINH